MIRPTATWDEVAAAFRDPPAAYRPMPFWFWNGRITPDEVERQIREMHAQGVGGFFIHARFGLAIEYLGDLWFQAADRAACVAGELGMQVWLYDEYPFPSGVAAGTLALQDRYRAKYLDIVARRATGPEEIAVDYPASGALISAVALGADGGQIDLAEHACDGRLTWSAPAGDWQILVFTEQIALCDEFIYGSEPDYFEPGMAQAYFDHTHEAYARRLGQYFGREIIGIFTDEPKIHCLAHMHDDPLTLPWWRTLLDDFQRVCGYDLRPRLASLVVGDTVEDKRVRRDYWRLARDLYLERFFDQYRDWCERHRLLLTGHLFLEEGLHPNTVYQSDVLRVLRSFHLPGVDHLGLTCDSSYGVRHLPRSRTRIHGQKVGSSAAHLGGAPRVLSESFGCAGWAMSMADMKWMADWQYALGVNLLCPHAFFYTIAGHRKFDAPPSQFYQATYWPHYRRFADYIGRLSLMLTQGRHRAPVALLYPRSTFWSEFRAGSPSETTALISEWFDLLVSLLPRLHLDYDLISEEDLAAAEIGGDGIQIADETYNLLLLPPLTVIAPDTADVLESLSAAGVPVVATARLADQCTDPTRDAEVAERVRALHRNGALLLVPGDKADEEAERAVADALKSALPSAAPVDIAGPGAADVMCLCRQVGDRHVAFIVNNHPAEGREVNVTMPGRAVELWDPESGEISALAGVESERERVRFRWSGPPRGSAIFVSGEATDARPLVRGEPEKVCRVVTLDGPWQFRALGPNIRPLRDLRCVIPPVPRDGGRAFEYTVHFRIESPVGHLHLALEDIAHPLPLGPTLRHLSIELNGQAISTEPMGHFVEPAFPMFDLTPAMRPGDNELLIRLRYRPWLGEPRPLLNPPLLLGDFAVADDTRPAIAQPPREVPTASWTTFGYPYYSGVGEYSAALDLPRCRRAILNCRQVADMVEVVVNEQSMAVRPWPPFTADITSALRPGANRIALRVTNSLANWLDSDPRPSGLLASVDLQIWAG